MIDIDQIKPSIMQAVRFALEEDIGTGDISATLIPADTTISAEVITKEACVVCGRPWVDAVFAQLGGVDLQWQVIEGELVEARTRLLTMHGNARSILTGERTALNFLQTLSGTATRSREMAQAAPAGVTVLDTRKTLPGLRLAQKYAVATGGCSNHRLGLYDAYLIKENHIAACGSITAAVALARSQHPERPVIVEVENLQEYQEAASLPVDRIMLDEFSDEDLQRVLSEPTSIDIEISGNIDLAVLANFRGLHNCHVSSGALTKHVRAVDLSLRVIGPKN